MNAPLISICIPSYQRVAFLERLLESILIQSFKDFEVVISDDSYDDNVHQLASKYADKFPVVYHKNSKPLGTPQNWNNAIENANGTWIKLMHDDDWFSSPTSLAEFADATKNGVDFIWCYYTEVYDSGKVVQRKYAPGIQLGKNPYDLFSKNIIGPPSSVMVRKSNSLAYDGRLKWLVDIDYYINQINHNGDFLIKKWLVNFAYNDSQVTNSCYLNKEVEIPESLLLYQKHGNNLIKTVSLYNAWWRLIRNLDIRNISEVEEFKGSYEIPSFLTQIIARQSRIPRQILRIGPMSMLLMTASFLVARRS